MGPVLSFGLFDRPDGASSRFLWNGLRLCWSGMYKVRRMPAILITELRVGTEKLIGANIGRMARQPTRESEI